MFHFVTMTAQILGATLIGCQKRKCREKKNAVNTFSVALRWIVVLGMIYVFPKPDCGETLRFTLMLSSNAETISGLCVFSTGVDGFFTSLSAGLTHFSVFSDN